MSIPVPTDGLPVVTTWGAAVAAGINGGVAFPASPAVGDRFWRTDLHMEFYWNGANWLSSQTFQVQSIDQVATQPYSATTGALANIAPFPNTVLGNTGILVTKVVTTFRVTTGGTALGASHKWVGTGQKLPSAGALSATVASIDSGASGAWRHINTSLADAMAADDVIDTVWTKTGTPGNLYVRTIYFYLLYF